MNSKEPSRSSTSRGTLPTLMRIERDAMGAEQRRELPGALSVEWERDVAGRPTARRTRRGIQSFATGHGQSAVAQVDAHSVIDELTYLWRGDDQIAAIIDPARGPRHFDHDARGRLVRETRPDRVVERAMDAVGNVYRSQDGRDRRYGAGGVLKEADGVRFAHDADGNQSEKVDADGTRWTYQWNGHGMLTTVMRHPPDVVPNDVAPSGTGPSGIDSSGTTLSDIDSAGTTSSEAGEFGNADTALSLVALRPADDGPLPPPDLRLSFAYDAFARRVSKSVVQLLADGTEVTADETRFVWDGHVVLHELTGSGGGAESSGGGELGDIARDPNALTTWYWDPGTFTPIAKEQNGQRWSIASDHLGTPTEMYDALGQLAWKMQLDVFGVPEFEVGEADDCPWRWPGQYEDAETGDYYNRWRYYDARAGRYSSQDPIGLEGGMCLFGYVNDSEGWFDPLGLTACNKLARQTRELKVEELNHAFDRHAAELFGREVTRLRDFGAFSALVDRVRRSGLTTPWRTGSSDTYAHLARVDGISLLWFNSSEMVRMLGTLQRSFDQAKNSLLVYLDQLAVLAMTRNERVTISVWPSGVRRIDDPLSDIVASYQMLGGATVKTVSVPATRHELCVQSENDFTAEERSNNEGGIRIRCTLQNIPAMRIHRRLNITDWREIQIGTSMIPCAMNELPVHVWFNCSAVNDTRPSKEWMPELLLSELEPLISSGACEWATASFHWLGPSVVDLRGNKRSSRYRFDMLAASRDSTLKLSDGACIGALRVWDTASELDYGRAWSALRSWAFSRV